MFSLHHLPNPEWIAYGREAQRDAAHWRRLAMADAIYICTGLLFFVVMGAYALACDRL